MQAVASAKAVYSDGKASVFDLEQPGSVTYIKYDGKYEYYKRCFISHDMRYQINYDPIKNSWIYIGEHLTKEWPRDSGHVKILTCARKEIIDAEVRARLVKINQWTGRILILRYVIDRDIIVYLVGIIARFLPWSYLSSLY